MSTFSIVASPEFAPHCCAFCSTNGDPHGFVHVEGMTDEVGELYVCSICVCEMTALLDVARTARARVDREELRKALTAFRRELGVSA